ncbi:hypothetical protein BDW74DRAFT_150812 [Aspergillus multicolor]|uniref:uncharacterized protein n=1 Tax=Aspergillus multicolor TaxID=41759 RepID=UPI003CCD7A17
MSADLFAEFGLGASTSQPSNTARQQAVTPYGGSLIPGLDVSEDATLSRPSHHLNEPDLLPGQRGTHNQPEHLDEFGDFELPQGEDNNDVLFDATLEQFSDHGSEDWGDFESAEVSVDQTGQKQISEPVGSHKVLKRPAPKVTQNHNSPLGSPGTVDLLGSLDSLTLIDKPPSGRHQANTLIDTIPEAERGSIHNTKPKLPVEEEPFEEWEDFTDGPMESNQSSSLKVEDPQQATDTGNLSQPLKVTVEPRVQTTRQSHSTHVRPTNIPPPSILLELFPQLFERLRKEGAEAKRNAQHKDRLDSVAESIVYTLKAVARVVAGRTLRWKRDSILSQSMRIGPARSGKSGGMKLSTVNKNEDIKERQEAVDIINMWRDRAALFNSVIQAAGRRPMQVILESTRAITATASQGAIKASHACALCGLKRDERIPRVDENAEDSFGEWWTEHWGHTECRLFWENNVSLLGQR